MDHNKLFETVEALQSKYEQIFLDVCNIESPTDCKVGVDAVGEYFIERAKELGLTVDVHEEHISGNAITLILNSDSSERPVAISGHMDTVHPIGSFGYPAAHIADGKLYGPGAMDCKGGIVAGLMAMEALKICGFDKRPILLILQSDEENGSRNSNKGTVNYMSRIAKNAVAFLNCEGHTKGYIVLERKGILKYEFRVKGKSVHASQCSSGISAIAEAAHKILELEKLKDGGEWGVTCNCGLIRGGSAENSVPAECIFTADIRIISANDEVYVNDIVNRIAATSYIEGSSCEVVLKSRRLPMPYCERNVALFDKINGVFALVGFPQHKPKKSSGGSDAADMTAAGIPTADNLGISGSNLHSVNEYAELSSLSECAKRLAAIAAFI
ncbi:MAG: M20/M25/M40 family metallo-hydrolase [Clostridia bacterium]|nr:M20/M25/M40 family metallo-hydrolase [Clostridia bacterium]